MQGGLHWNPRWVVWGDMRSMPAISNPKRNIVSFLLIPVLTCLFGCVPIRQQSTWRWEGQLPAPPIGTRQPLVVYVDRVEGIERQTFKDEIKKSWDRWAARMPEVGFDLDLRDGRGLGIGPDGMNVISMVATGASNSPAREISRYDQVSEWTLDEVDFELAIPLNPEKEKWGDCDCEEGPPTTNGGRVFDVCEIMTHEWGHVFGLGDCRDRSDRFTVMAERKRLRSCARLKLRDIDKTAAADAYRGLVDREPDDDSLNTNVDVNLGIGGDWTHSASIVHPMDHDVYVFHFPPEIPLGHKLVVSVTAPEDLPVEAKLSFRSDFWERPPRIRWLRDVDPGDTVLSDSIAVQGGSWVLIMNSPNIEVLQKTWSDSPYTVRVSVR